MFARLEHQDALAQWLYACMYGLVLLPFFAACVRLWPWSTSLARCVYGLVCLSKFPYVLEGLLDTKLAFNLHRLSFYHTTHLETWS